MVGASTVNGPGPLSVSTRSAAVTAATALAQAKAALADESSFDDDDVVLGVSGERQGPVAAMVNSISMAIVDNICKRCEQCIALHENEGTDGGQTITWNKTNRY